MFRVFGGIADSYRDRAYSALLRQDVAFFDKSENNVGTLTTMLAGDAESASRLTQPVQTAILVPISMLSMYFSTMVFGDWRLVLAMTPLLILLSVCRGAKEFVRMKSFHHRQKKDEEGFKIFYEALSSIRTVKQFNMGKRIIDNFKASAEKTLSKTRVDHVTQGLLMTLCELGLWGSFAGTTILCAVIVRYADGSPVRMVITIGSFLSLLQLSDTATRGFADAATSSAALTKLQLVEACHSAIEETLPTAGAARTSTADADADAAADAVAVAVAQLSEGADPAVPISDAVCPFAVEFDRLTFAYPTRAELQVLRDVTLAVPVGTSAACVVRLSP